MSDDPNPFKLVTYGAAEEKGRRQQIVDLMRDCPIPDEELLSNLGLFLTPQTLSRILFMDFIYQKILEVQGVIMEFGCRWGQNASLYSAFRGIYEPFARLRKVVAFDTFAGFPSVEGRDGDQMHRGAYATTTGYENYLDAILQQQEQESPQAHIRKFEIVKGDVTETLPEYLARHPETLIALAYFDLDIYQPTVTCLNLIRDRITKGTVLGFDELNDHSTPGETLALKEALGLDRFAVKRYRYNARCSYLVID
jgi:hypothetical protein